MEDYRLDQSGQEVQDILNGAAMQVDLTAETERATEAEQTLQGNIDAEATRATEAEGTLQGNIDAEEDRAKAAEKQNADDIDAIEEKIPSGASSSNKLATEEYVNDSVATATATFRGTYNVVTDLGLTISATHAQIATALAGAIMTADNNDYSFVLIPTSAETPWEIASIERYKFNGAAWGFEYVLNNSGFTAAQWAAINSGITSGDVAKLAALPTNAQLTTLLAGLQSDIDAEATRAQGAEGTLQDNIDAEEARAKAAEKQNADDIDAIEEKIPSVASSSNKLATESEINSLSSAIEAILLLIPSAATSLNKLADKAFVNSTIATATATFRGTYNLVDDLGLTTSATHAQIATALAGAILTADNNDYAFVQIPTSDAMPTEIAKTERYKFNGTAWEYEYDLNNSGFTADQWAAINSGITQALVTKLSDLPTNAQLTTELGTLTSGITTINQKIPNAASQANKLVDTAAMESYIVQVLDVLTASFNVTSTDGHVTVQISQVDGKITSVAVSTSDIASAAALNLKASQADLTALASRVTTAEGNITSLGGRMTTAEGNITSLGGRMTTAEGNITSLGGRVSTNETDIANLQQLYNDLQQSKPVPVTALPSTGQQQGVIYRLAGTTSYSDYMWNGSSWVLMATYNNAIDQRPKKASQNLVTSGGVFDNMGALDVSELNATENPHTLAQYVDLSAALAAIPTDYQKGGMSIKFVQSSDNKYVQYRLMADAFSITVSDWQGIDEAPTAESKNLVTSGGVYGIIYDAKSFDIETGIWNTTKTIDFNFEAGKTYAIKVNSFTSKSNLNLINFTLIGEGLENLSVENKLGGYNFVVGSQGTVTPNAQYTQLRIYLAYKNVPNPNTDTLNYDCYEVNPNAIDRRLTNLEDLTEKTSDDLEAEINRAQIAEDTNADNIANVSAQVDDIIDAISTTEIKDVTSQLVLIDNQSSHYIKADGSFGEDGMYLRRFKVEGGYSLNLKTRAYINSGITSLMYAFYSSDSVFDATTFISGSQIYTGVHVEQLSFDGIAIPSNAKTIVFCDRGGGTTQLVIAYKNIDVVKDESIKQILDYPASKIIKYIKSDGTGDYANIQEAINSITDASFVNQYELRLCNDEIYTDMTDLWLVSSPSTHNVNANPTSAIAAIVTKDWIDIVGYGGRRKIAVYAPDTMDVTKQGNIQCMYLQGNVTIDGVDFEIKNGRYAIHQESGGNTSSPDHNAITILRNSNVSHLGNKTGTGYWSSCYAQANGTCSGLQLEYHNVVWSPAFYLHQNGNVTTNNSYLFKNCRIDYPANGEFNSTPLGVYIGMNGSGQNPDIQFYGCDMWQMTFVIDMFDNNVANDYAHDIRSYIPNWVGCGNALMKYPQIDIAPYVLTLKTNEVNHSISVKGGTAKALIFGDGFKTYTGTSNAVGICYGSEFIGKRGNNTVFTLGSRLGDCSAVNKTLIIEYDSNEYTLTFNEDYSSMDNGTIKGKINSMLTALGLDAATTNQMIHEFQFSFPMKDTSVIGRNYGTVAIQNGSAVKRDYTHGMGWVLCSAGETPDGVACERINPNESGVIALIDRNYFPPLYGLYGAAKPVGTMLKTGADGKWQETTTEGEAILIAVAPDCFVKK